MRPDQKFFIFDGESVGLHGQTFAVAGGVYDVHGQAVSEFAYHTDAENAEGVLGRQAEDREWVARNVTIRADSECVSRAVLAEMLYGRWVEARNQHPGILMAVECGWPVEARVLIQMIEQNPRFRNWDGPYPLHEIATFMLAAGMDPMATYERLPAELPAHEPLADARLSARLLAVALAKLNLIDR